MTVLELYCDGGCRGNQHDRNVGGWGAYLVWGDHTKRIKGSATDTTNNKMELTAAIKGLQAIKRTDVPVRVYLDSAYVQKGITEWVPGWVKRGWVNSKREPVANRDLWQQLIAERDRFEDIRFLKVKGHANNEGNNIADALVNQAMDEM